MIAKAERKNTTCPTGTASPSERTSACITANMIAEASLSRIPLMMLTCNFYRRPRRRLTESPAVIEHADAALGSPPGPAGPYALFLLRLFRLFRRLGAFDRRQRLDVGRDRLAVGFGQALRRAHHFGHRSADRIAGGRGAGGENLDDVGLGIIADALGRDVRDPVVAHGGGAAGEALALDDAAEEVARAVAFGAVAGAVDQIGAAIPGGGFARVGLERRGVEEQQFPHTGGAADV